MARTRSSASASRNTASWCCSRARARWRTKLKAVGYKVVWTEFPSGPPLLEALNVGAIDFGNTGEAPPIFAQAAGAPLVYVAYEPPAPKGEAILVPKDSSLKSVADLKGKKVALNKGSNVHYLLVKALEKAGRQILRDRAGVSGAGRRTRRLRARRRRCLGDLGSVPGGGGSGHRRAHAGRRHRHRRRTTSSICPRRNFSRASPAIVDRRSWRSSARSTTGPRGDIHAVAEQLAPSIGLPVPVVEVALKRQAYGIKPVTSSVIADQQQVADAFFALGLMPKAIRISDAAAEAGHMSTHTSSKANILWFLPTHGDGRYLGTTHRRPRGQLQLSAPDRAGRRSARLFRRAAADRAELRGFLGRRLQRWRRGPSGCAISWRCGPACNRRASPRA